MGAAYLNAPPGPRAAAAAEPTTELRPVPTERAGAKRLATLSAVSALAGFELRETADGDGFPAYQVSRWNLCKVLPDLDAVEAFLRRAGARTSRG